MTMTNEQLEEAVALIFEKDAKRTPGEWRTSPYSDSRVFWEGSREALASCNEGIIFTEYPAEDNAAFIATAPLMAQVIRQLWAEREQQRAVMAQAKPVEVWELAAIISDAVHDNPFAILSEKSPLTAEQERKRASAILSRYNVTKKEEV